ncbi:MAG TPA: GntR family transcriptional regulator [Phycisphaerae bacterium]|nr:GntR family transcriptional regulator [Phycisphaerae bacterium]
MSDNKVKSKHRSIYEHLRNAIASGEYAVGQRVPTEAELGAHFAASRLTVARAMRELERQGLLVRRRGAGTFVRRRHSIDRNLFGLIVPIGEPGKSIFGRMCGEVARVGQANGFGLLWGDSLSAEPAVQIQRAEKLCEECIARKVAGVFFAPLEVPRDQIAINEKIANSLRAAGIAVVLVDRDIYDYPDRSRFDLVAIDNRRSGYMVTKHLLDLGCRRIDFIAGPMTVATVTARVEGYQDALLRHGITPDPRWIDRSDVHKRDALAARIRTSDAEAFVCVNDYTAALVMHHLSAAGIRVPQDIRLVGFDDVELARFLPVPLTTLHQPAEEMGAVATKLMLERLASPNAAPRHVMLSCELIVRESSGGVASGEADASAAGSRAGATARSACGSN